MTVTDTPQAADIPRTAEQWAVTARNMPIQSRAFIDGAFVDARSGATIDSISPVDGSVITSFAACEVADVDDAVAAARRAFDDGRWSEASPRVRRETLLDLARLVRAHRITLGAMITLDAGRPISAALGEVDHTADVIQFFAEAIDKTFGEVPPTATSAFATVTRDPIGVVGAVVPWNFPLSMPVWKIAPALSVGNSVVVKPAEQAPLVVQAFAELVAAAGVPDGVFNVVPGMGETAGAALGRHRDVDKIAFTGSNAVGRLFQTYAAQSNLKSVSLELGGKSPQIVLADAPDLDAAARAGALGGFVNQGEMCSAGSRLIVEESILDEFLIKLQSARESWLPGDPFDPETTMGPLIDAESLSRVRGFIDSGSASGATLFAGGDSQAPAGLGGGFYLDPVIFTDVDNSMPIAREEIFGPVLSVIAASDADHALRIANDSRFGLAAAVWSTDVRTIHKFTRRLRAGTVWVNCYNKADVNVPFGGYKESGSGRDKSLHCLEQYTQLKTTWMDLDV
ncbi:aldehyde dehydrogenase family protein [Gordonia sp. NPDC003376]